MKSIVFGGSGFLGSHVAEALTEAGHEVVVFDVRPSRHLHPGQTMIVGDIRDAAAVAEAMRGCDYVYHFAGIASLDDATTRPLETVVQNIEGTVILLDAARNESVKRFVYAGTIYVYSNKGGFYRCSKQAAELYIEEYQRVYGLPYTTLRFGTVYGPRAGTGNSIHRYLKSALLDKRIVVAATGEEIREYVHVRDAARLSVDILDPRHENQRVIITGEHRMKFRDFLEVISELFEHEVKIVLEPPEPSSAHYNVTPYQFSPRIGYKLVGTSSLDLGQGLLECVNEIHFEATPQDLVPPDLDDRLPKGVIAGR